MHDVDKAHSGHSRSTALVDGGDRHPSDDCFAGVDRDAGQQKRDGLVGPPLPASPEASPALAQETLSRLPVLLPAVRPPEPPRPIRLKELAVDTVPAMSITAQLRRCRRC